MNKKELEEYVFHITCIYNEYLEKKEKRNISYGELSYLQSLNEEQLREIENEIEKEMESDREMEIKEYMKNIKDIEKWKEEEIKEHLKSYKEKDIEEIDNMFLMELIDCSTMEEIESIVKRYII